MMRITDKLPAKFYFEISAIITLAILFLVVVSPVTAASTSITTGAYCPGLGQCTGPGAYYFLDSDNYDTIVQSANYSMDIWCMSDPYSTSPGGVSTYAPSITYASSCMHPSGGIPTMPWIQARDGHDGTRPAYFFYWNATNTGGAWTGNITADFTANQTSGYPTLYVQFTDLSSNIPTSWDWDFGDGSSHSSSQNPIHGYTTAGTYTVTLIASKSGSSDTETKTGYITVNPWSPPVAAFSCSPTNTTSPDLITCTDSSTNDPTSWQWQFDSFGVSMSPGGSYGGGLYTAFNSTQNPSIYMDGSGTVDVRLTVTNPGGSTQEFKQNYITVSGIAPTPTPTPNIPWPNQTGVCWQSLISLGSQQTRAFYVHYQLTNPYGDTYSGQYYPGELNLISNQPFFTALTGLYIYNEYDMTDNSLVWRQSYVVEDCTVTPTPTTTSVFPTPTVTYTLPPTYPTVTIPTAKYTVPVTQVPYATMTAPPVIQTYPTIYVDVNATELYDYTVNVSPASKPIITYVKGWLDQFIKGASASFLALMISPFSYIISGIPQSMTQFTSLMISFAAYPFAILYAIGVFVRNMPVKVQFVLSIILWSNIIFYYFDFFKRGAR